MFYNIEKQTAPHETTDCVFHDLSFERRQGEISSTGHLVQHNYSTPWKYWSVALFRHTLSKRSFIQSWIKMILRVFD